MNFLSNNNINNNWVVVVRGYHCPTWYCYYYIKMHKLKSLRRENNCRSVHMEALRCHTVMLFVLLSSLSISILFIFRSQINYPVNLGQKCQITCYYVKIVEIKYLNMWPFILQQICDPHYFWFLSSESDPFKIKDKPLTAYLWDKKWKCLCDMDADGDYVISTTPCKVTTTSKSQLALHHLSSPPTPAATAG